MDTWDIQPPLSDDTFRWQRGVITNGEWAPLLTPKGYLVFNDRHRNILLKGCRKSSKTISFANRFTRHLWENDGAVGGVFARTMKNGMGGAWNDLVNFVFPGWQYANIGFKVIERGTNASTKMPFVRIRNKHGGISEAQLHSVNHEPDIEAQVMGLRFSAIWFSQAEQFMSVDTYRILLMQLRMEMFGIPREEHVCGMDANPPETGTDHWLHDVFEKAKVEGTKFYRPDYHDHFSSYDFSIDDNPLLDPRDKEELYNTYKSDPVKLKRFYFGEWVRDTAEGHFDKTFGPRLILGNADDPDRSKWEVITPHKNARTLLVGIDTGALSHAAGFWVSRTDARGLVCYDAFDEVVSIDKPVSVRSFAEQVWERVKFWNEWMMKTYGLAKPPEWRFWADSSLWNYSSTANNNDAQIFWDVSDGGMGLRPVVKGRGSIMQRIGLFNRLFFEDRAFISAHCKWAISWARFLKPGRAKNQPVSQATMEFKHKFDADSYCISSEIPYEMDGEVSPSVATGIITTG